MHVCSVYIHSPGELWEFNEIVQGPLALSFLSGTITEPYDMIKVKIPIKMCIHVTTIAAILIMDSSVALMCVPIIIMVLPGLKSYW